MREKTPYKKIVIFLLSMSISLLTLPAYGDSKIVITDDNYRFGEINEGTDISHEFVIENKGDSDLIINNIQPG